MVERVSASITIGGILLSRHLREFLTLIMDEGLSLEWDGKPFTASQFVSGAPLALMDHEVALGQFIPLEDFCVARGLLFRRWSGGCANWGPQRVVFNGTGCARYLSVNDGGTVLIDRQTIENLGDMEDVFAWFDAADLEIPPLVVVKPGRGDRLFFLVEVVALLPLDELDEESRALPGTYAIALDPTATDREPDTLGFVEAAKDIFHNAVPIDNLDDCAIEVSLVGSRDEIPEGARWLTEADSILPALPGRGGFAHG